MKSSFALSFKAKNKLLSEIHTSKERRKFWLETSGAMYEMCYNPLYYFRLLKEKGQLLSIYTEQIEKDLERTFPKEDFFKSAKGFEVLRNILTAYSWRNPNVGYCQGMNFIAGRFLTLGFSELETFWLLVQIVEKVLPFEYFSTMTGVMQDQKIFDYLLRTRIPKVAEALDNLDMNSSLITVQWFICIYAYTFNTNVVVKIWDEIFMFGHTVIYKISLAVFWMLKKEIPKKKELTEVFDCVEKKCKEITDPKKLMKIANMKQFRIKPILLEKLKESAEKEVKEEISERYDIVMTEAEIFNRIDCGCGNEDECKQKDHLTTGYFTFLGDEGICIEDEYLDSEEYRKEVDVSLVRDSKSIIIGRKNHSCNADQEGLERKYIQNNVRSSFIAMAGDLMDFD